jgi:hydroxymethylpyrimidine pyrophosphatase-like HAD family hydrolase
MGNASDEVKSIADFIAPSNDEGGVAFAIRKVLNL